jgi:hypothetical protein
MEPSKVVSPGRFLRVTRQGGRKKERMEELENFVDMEEITTS